jgi:hypothetical protein
MCRICGIDTTVAIFSDCQIRREALFDRFKKKIDIFLCFVQLHLSLLAVQWQQRVTKQIERTKERIEER